MVPKTIGFSEAKRDLSRLTEEVNRSGQPVIIYKYNRPWVQVIPVSPGYQEQNELKDIIGTWQDTRTADEIANELKQARVFNDKRVSL